MSNRYKLAARYTEKYRARLHPCPYCKNKRVEVVADREHTTVIGPDGKKTWGPTSVFWAVACATHACDCTASYPNVEDAVRSWEQNHTEKRKI